MVGDPAKQMGGPRDKGKEDVLYPANTGEFLGVEGQGERGSDVCLREPV